MDAKLPINPCMPMQIFKLKVVYFLLLNVMEKGHSVSILLFFWN